MWAGLIEIHPHKVGDWRQGGDQGRVLDVWRKLAFGWPQMKSSLILGRRSSCPSFSEVAPSPHSLVAKERRSERSFFLAKRKACLRAALLFLSSAHPRGGEKKEKLANCGRPVPLSSPDEAYTLSRTRKKSEGALRRSVVEEEKTRAIEPTH